MANNGSGNETMRTIFERRAVRKYKDKAVDRKLIEEIMAAGRMAPSAINKQPWRFYILTNKEDIQQFSKEIVKAAAKGLINSSIKQIIKTAADFLHFPIGINFSKDVIFHQAPVVIFITSPKDNEWAALDIGMCAQNMMLAAKSMGLDSCPVGLGKFVENTESYPRLQIPQKEHVLLSVVFGYGDESPAVHERIKTNALYI